MGSRTDQYFAINRTPSHMKGQLAFVCMEGSVLHWFRWIHPRNPNGLGIFFLRIVTKIWR